MLFRWRAPMEGEPRSEPPVDCVEGVAFNPVLRLPGVARSYALAPFRLSYRAYTPSVEVHLYRWRGGRLERLEPAARHTVFAGGGVRVGVDVYPLDGLDDVVAVQLVYDEDGHARAAVSLPRRELPAGDWRGAIRRALRELAAEAGVEPGELRVRLVSGREPPFVALAPGGSALAILPTLLRDWTEEGELEIRALLYRFNGARWERVEGVSLPALGSRVRDDSVVVARLEGVAPHAVALAYRPGPREEYCFILPLQPPAPPVGALHQLLEVASWELDVEVRKTEVLPPPA